LRFLLPYSTDLNPIETTYSKIRALLKKAATSTPLAMVSMIGIPSNALIETGQPLEAQDQAAPCNSMVEVVLRNGRVLRLSEDVATARAVSLADALEGFARSKRKLRVPGRSLSALPLEHSVGFSGTVSPAQIKISAGRASVLLSLAVESLLTTPRRKKST
jgi:hypothetical protein